jgi:colanic acid biosynthesis glycosyl transferase WcaI
MRILFMAQCYAPENVSGAVLITELATDLAKRGHCVSITTGAPSYPEGRVFKGYRNCAYSVETLDGVQVIRTWSYIAPSKKVLPRLLHYGTYSATALYGGLFAGRPDVIVSYSPPLPLGISAWLLSRFWRVPWVLQLEDLYPDAAVAAGVMTNARLIAFFGRMEQFLYHHAQRISVISKAFRQALLAKGVADSKMEVIPVWADPDQVPVLAKNNPFRHEHGLDGKFVVLYAGNLGLTSCLEDVIQAAEILKEWTEIKFVIVGDGVKKESLEAGIRARALTNILLLPYQPRPRFPEMLAAADLSLVTLNAGAAVSSLPSKLFNIMASARPILAVAPSSSEVVQIVQEAGCGWSVPPGAPHQLAHAIFQLKGRNSSLLEMGNHGRSCLQDRYARNHCVDLYEKMLSALLEGADLQAAQMGSIL